MADADALYKVTNGKVQNEKTCKSLSKAVKSRDADAIAGAVRAVNDPKAAKEKSGAETRAKAEREAAEQATGSTGGSAGSYASGSPRTYSGNSGFYGTKRNYEQLNTTQASRQNQQQSTGACPNGAVCGAKPDMNSHSILECPLTGSCSGGSDEAYYW